MTDGTICVRCACYGLPHSHTGFCGCFSPPERHYGVKNQVPTSWNTSYTRVAGCFEALALKIERKSKDLRLLSELQLLPVKVCPRLRDTLACSAPAQSRAVYRPECYLFAFSSLQPVNWCHGRCWLQDVVCGWAKQPWGWLGDRQPLFVLGGGLWAHTWPPTGTFSAELLALRTSSAGSVIRPSFIAVTYIACGLNHMVILLCSISACLFFIFPHPLHLLLAAFPAPFLQRGSYINRSL